MKIKTKLSIFTLLCIPVVALGMTVTFNSLSKDDTLKLIKDVTIKIHPEIVDNNNKFVHKTVQIYFAPDGTVQGKALTSTIPGQPKTDQGTWKVKEDGELCMEWKHWGSPCLRIYPLKYNYLFIMNTNHGAALLPDAEIHKGNVDIKD